MDPPNDIICSLLETPFTRRKDDDKRAVLTRGRPTDELTICAKKEIKKTGKSYNINFKKAWFTDFVWLCSSSVLQKLFCWPCLLYSNKNTVWNKEGFADLLNITRSLHIHADSAEHIKCQLKLKTFEKNQYTIVNAVKENDRLYTVHFNENVRLNRRFLQMVIDTVLYFSKQELPFGGHDESSDPEESGPFKELLTLVISTSPLETQNHYTKIKNVFSGDCKTIQNELVECISEYIHDYVVNEVNEANFFSIQVNDASDTEQNTERSIILRFVNSNGLLVERFLGFHEVSDRSSENLYNLLDDILEQFDYEHKLIAQCYDGASIQPEHLNELQRRLKAKAPQAIFVNCLSNHLNCVLQESFMNILKCRIFFATINSMPPFFRHAARLTNVITSTSARHIPILIETRWSSSSKLLNVIIEDWDKLKYVFECIIDYEHSDSKSLRLSTGFLDNLNDFEFTFQAVVFNDIFGLTDDLFETLQEKSLDNSYCLSRIETTRGMLQNKRNDETFNALYEKATKMTHVSLKHLSQEEMSQKYSILFYEIIDRILMEMEVRFQDYEKLQFVCLVDNTMFELYNSCFPSTAFENLQQFFGHIFIKMQRLKNELGLLYNDDTYANLSPEQILQRLNENKDVFTEAYKLFSLVLTIPSTSVSTETNFSCIKRMQSYIKNTRSQESRASLANISIQKELLLELVEKQPFYEDITDKFAALNDRTIDLIYKK